MTESRVKKYKRYKKRIEGYKREIEMYQFSLKHKGKAMWAKELADHFGYYESIRYGGYPGLLNTRLGKYIRLLPHRKGQKRFLQFKDIVWMPQDKFIAIFEDTRRLTTFDCGTNPSSGYRWVKRSKVPFWVLAEYGGSVKDEDFINELTQRIQLTENKIKYLKLGEKWMKM